MDDILLSLGTLFVIFLILSAAVEAVLESFRGLLELCGITLLKGKVTVEDALKLAGEFASGNGALKAKAEAIKVVADQLGAVGQSLSADLRSFQPVISAPSQPDAVDVEGAAYLSGLTAKVKEALDQSEGRRVLLLRFISIVLGAVITALSHVEILKVIGGSGALANAAYLDPIVGGLAASVGSSYWHDQLDRVRKLKDVSKQLTAVVKQQ